MSSVAKCLGPDPVRRGGQQELSRKFLASDLLAETSLRIILLIKDRKSFHQSPVYFMTFAEPSVAAGYMQASAQLIWTCIPASTPRHWCTVYILSEMDPFLILCIYLYIIISKDGYKRLLMPLREEPLTNAEEPSEDLYDCHRSHRLSIQVRGVSEGRKATLMWLVRKKGW